MALFSKKNGNGNFFDKNIEASCSYCALGNRTKDGMKIFCTKKGPVELNYSCSFFNYSPLKRVPTKQLHVPGNFDDGAAIAAKE
ncbi:hypothetical protein FACS1894132_14180 [Clostridia bacterium]|nr:hypothetical protein FACS1894132_14180 [Clostridia bacterium]